MNRAVVAAALSALLLTSGCIGFLSGEESLSFQAQSVSVSEEAKSETTYGRVDRGSTTLNRSFADRNVRVTNRYVELARSSDLPVFGDTRVARFTVFATPQVKIAGQVFNPVSELNNTELVLRLQQQYESLSGVRKVSNRTETMFGAETTVTKFRGEATTKGGQDTDVFVHVAKMKHEGDFVIAVAVYPTQLEGEEAKVDRLLEGVQHGA